MNAEQAEPEYLMTEVVDTTIDGDGQVIADEITASAATALVHWKVTSREELRPQLLVNNHRAGEKILAHLLRELRSCESFDFSVAFVRESGLILIADALEELARKGVRGRILTGTYLSFNEPKAFRRLLAMDNVDVRVFNGALHAKGYFFHRGTSTHLMVGSANLTDTALTANQEWNLAVSSTDSGELVRSSRKEFDRLWNHEKTSELTKAWIDEYEEFYKQQSRSRVVSFQQTLDGKMVQPNSMQRRALAGLEEVRERGGDKALVISATGTGKTYLAAFDVRECKPKRMLFIVHRERIARAALESFRRVLPKGTSLGLYTGSERDLDADYVFATVQTLARPDHLTRFSQTAFDYIIIDEVHRAGATSYLRILDHFEPRFLLGMSATPERTDGFDIYALFDHNIAYEIRLQDALEHDMLTPFHYFGVSDIVVDGVELEDKADFSKLVSNQRVNHVIEAIERYGFSGDKVHGLVFCSRNDEAEQLAASFREHGYRALALSGSTGESAREAAIERLEMEEGPDALDYLFTVDIFNEGIDIPSVNQIVMLRPTQSAIVFVQQLGRGLRTAPDKDYVVVIDFIGNYEGNYLIPMALFGDRSGTHERLRRLVFGGSEELPGSSTVTFDEVSAEKVIRSINQSNMSKIAFIKQAYKDVRNKVGHIPTLEEFEQLGSLDPTCFYENPGSYDAFLSKYEPDYDVRFSPSQKELLRFASTEFGYGKRLAETIILEALTVHPETTIQRTAERIHVDSEVMVDGEIDGLSHESALMQARSGVSCLDLSWYTNRDREKLTIPFALADGETIRRSPAFEEALSGDYGQDFAKQLLSICNVAHTLHDRDYAVPFNDRPFVLGARYGRKDVCRLACWEQNMTPQNIGGYLFRDNDWAIFVTYDKDEEISATINYHDHFKNRSTMHWVSKNRRSLESKDAQKLLAFDPAVTRIHLFVKKSDGEGGDHYYLGTIRPGTLTESTIPGENGEPLSVFETDYTLDHPVDPGIYDYLVG